MSWIESSLGETLLTKSGIQNAVNVLNGKKFIGLYFSAHWYVDSTN